MGVSTVWGTVSKDHSIKKAENHLGSQRMTSGTQKVNQVFSLRQGSLEKPSQYLINLRRCCSNLNVAYPSQAMYSSSWGSCLGRLRTPQGLKPLWETWVDVGRLWVFTAPSCCLLCFSCGLQYDKPTHTPASVCSSPRRTLSPQSCKPRINPYSLKLLSVCYLVTARRYVTNADALSGMKSQFLLSSDGNIKVKHFIHSFKEYPIKDGLVPKRSSYLIF